MYGAIIGDICGSYYEFGDHRTKSKNPFLFQNGSKFTDDTVMTIATMKWYIDGKKNPIETYYRWYGLKYPKAGYGGMFRQWLADSTMGPYQSFGNGSAMRVSPVAWMNNCLKDILKDAKITAECTHNDPEGIKGAQATASAIYLARVGQTKNYIKAYISNNFGYDLERKLDDIRPNYHFDSTCQGSVPEAIICFLEGRSYEETIKLAISLGGDADTQAAIAGSIAEAYYGGVPAWMKQKAAQYVLPHFEQELREYGKLESAEFYKFI